MSSSILILGTRLRIETDVRFVLSYQEVSLIPNSRNVRHVSFRKRNIVSRRFMDNRCNVLDSKNLGVTLGQEGPSRVTHK